MNGNIEVELKEETVIVEINVDEDSSQEAKDAADRAEDAAERAETAFDNIDLLLAKKEDSDNKSNFVTDADSSVKFPTWSAITLWVKEKLNAALNSKSAPDSTDVIIIADNSDSGKTKKITFSNILIWFQGFFQTKDDQIEISSNSTVQNSWNGKTILFTANCTITVPASLNSSVMFPFRTLSGVTVLWAITSPFTWETTPSTTPEKTVGHFMRRGSSNTIILDM